MSINTKKVTGRREVRYASLDELLADAERCARRREKARQLVAGADLRTSRAIVRRVDRWIRLFDARAGAVVDVAIDAWWIDKVRRNRM